MESPFSFDLARECGPLEPPSTEPPLKRQKILNIKEGPEPGEDGITRYFGYMDNYFMGEPPRPSDEVFVDNQTLDTIQNL